MNFLIENKVIIVSVLFGISEALAQIPSIKSNSVFQLFSQLLKLGKK